MKVFLSILFFTTSIAQAEIWKYKNQWSPEWEARYSEWVKTNWNKKFFANQKNADGSENIYYGMSPDCADTVYSMRIIFSFENKLPFVIQDPTDPTKVISNSATTYYFTFGEKSKIREFLNDVWGITSSHSLGNDSYPVAISKNTIIPGALIRTTDKNHHSWTIQDILPIGVPRLIYNSVTGADWGSWTGYVLMERTSWPNPAWFFEGNQTPSGLAGIRYWKNPDFVLKPDWEHPGYSDEQYKIPTNNWVKYVQSRIATVNESVNEQLHRLLNTACVGMQERIKSIKEADEFLRNNNRCMDYPTYDTYSTPNRDHRIFDDLISLRHAYLSAVQNQDIQNIPQDFVRQLQKIYPFIDLKIADEAAKMQAQVVDSDSICTIEYNSNTVIDIAEAKRRLFLGRFSNNPHDSLAYRWGELKGPSPLAKKCQSWDPWTPDLNQDN